MYIYLCGYECVYVYLHKFAKTNDIKSNHLLA